MPYGRVGKSLDWSLEINVVISLFVCIYCCSHDLFLLFYWFSNL